MPPALRSACATLRSASRAWSDIRLEVVRWASGVSGAPSGRMAAMRCCSATCTGCGSSPGMVGMFMSVCTTDMNECQTGEAKTPPVVPPDIGRLSSLPSQTAPTYLPVKPTNQTSLGPVEVPVLPATLVKSSCARCPVPSVMTLFIIQLRPSATLRSTTCGASGSSRSRL